jgi:hypothetical protein
MWVPSWRSKLTDSHSQSIGADKEEKKRFIAALQKQKDVSASDLQKNVFKQ